MKLAEVCGKIALNRDSAKTNDIVVLQRSIRVKGVFSEDFKTRRPASDNDGNPGEVMNEHHHLAQKNFG
ncbi:hypothetical protein V1T76_23925 [Roseibium sp. FZY0029]|uniref:hypothetical protein n=1 Tax=Roseibium sp. FZY0029 TaxID=3116647 RepID=UPI002EBDA797|nr:hypothetical protein [Roseibium sp. FZY0029]